MGKVLFALLAESKDAAEKERYRKALYALRAQLVTQPRTADGGFWHKQIYPHQMWADGIYMASPFLAQFAAVFGEPAALDDAVKQVLVAEKHLRDAKTGLLYHGWDESKKERWANPRTGLSSQFWGRGVGWYAMGVADVLAEMPKDHPKRAAVVAVLRRLATRDRPVCRTPRPASGGRCWTRGAARQLHGGLGVGDVRLRADEGGRQWLARREAVRRPSPPAATPAP